MRETLRCLVQAYDDRHDALAEVSIPLMRQWCDMHGWVHRVVRFGSSDDRFDHNYRKYPLVRESLSHNDIVLWADADVVPVSWEDFPFYDSNVTISQDRNGFCAGVVAYRSSVWTKDFLAGLTALIPLHGFHRTHEQDCMKSVMLIGQACDNVRTIPETVVACPDSPKISDKPVFLHVWANAGVDQAVLKIKEACTFNQAQSKPTAVNG